MQKDKEYWLSKHPVAPVTYNSRPIPGTQITYPIDVRRFLAAGDIVIPAIAGTDPDDIVLKAQQFVCLNFSYIPDASLGCPEYWLFASESHARKRGDCEDFSIYMANIILNSISQDHYWRLRVNAGLVGPSLTAPDGGHCWLTWFRMTDNEPVVVDGCYYPDPKVPVAQKPILKENKRYLKNWFSFDITNAFAYEKLELFGRSKDGLSVWKRNGGTCP